MAFFIILSNIALTIVVGFGIHAFSHSILWAVVGAFAITGAASANPIFAFLAYPAIEYFFNDGQLTKYAAMSVGINAMQMLLVVYVAVKSPKST